MAAERSFEKEIRPDSVSDLDPVEILDSDPSFSFRPRF